MILLNTRHSSTSFCAPTTKKQGAMFTKLQKWFTLFRRRGSYVKEWEMWHIGVLRKLNTHFVAVSQGKLTSLVATLNKSFPEAKEKDK